MKIHKNIGNLDFIIRIILFIGFVYLALEISPWFYLLVAWELFVLYNRWSIVYELFGINTIKGKLKIDEKKLVITFLVIVGIMAIVTFLDYLVHSLEAEYAVAFFYYRNKIIYGVIIGAVTCWFMRNKKIFAKSLVFSLVISVLLQTNYLLQGYSMYFVFLFLVVHFSLLLPVSWIGFKLFDKYLK